MLQYERVLILGDFNIHVCCPSSSSFTSDFMKLLDSFSLTQYVKHISRFSEAFMSSSTTLNAGELHILTIDNLVSGFNSSCTNILDSIAPVRLKKLKPNSLPWLKE